MNIVSRAWKLLCSPCWFGHPNLVRVRIDGELWFECEQCQIPISKYSHAPVIKDGPMAIQREIKGQPNCKAVTQRHQRVAEFQKFKR